MRILATCALFVLLLAPSHSREPDAAPNLWFFVSTNLLAQEQVEEIEGLIERASAAGYSKMLLTDTKFSLLDQMPARYFVHVDRVKAAAAEYGVQVVPALLKMGWSNSMLANDPNLAEAMPVRDALFVVRTGQARLEADPPVSLRGGDMSDLSQWDWRDEMVTADDGAAKVTDPLGRNARIVQTIRVQPYRQYRISVRLRTEAFQGTPQINVLAGRAGGRTLAQSRLGAQSTQPWRMHHVVFNSMEHDEVTVYLGVWNGRRGQLWWDDASVEEVGLLNLVRRASSPVSVRLEDGKALRAGLDYAPFVDERLGQHRYSVAHEGPPIELLRPLPDGTRLRVSYEHAITVTDGQAMICPSLPQTVELMRDQAKRVHEAWEAPEYFLYYEEIRILNHDHACTSRGLSAGEILADNVRTAIEIMREVNPVQNGAGGLYIWSDMFDPNHNARRDYFLVNGDLAKSWEGLDPDVTVAAWHFDKREESLTWFTKRGHKVLIAGYYDHPVEQIDQWLDAAATHDGVMGVMYTTWRNSYDDLEAFAERVRKWGRDRK